MTTISTFEPGLAPITEAEVTQAFLQGPHRFVRVDGHQIATWRFGRGPDVVCVHGWPLHGATFRRIIPDLARDFTVHVLDLPFVGKTVSTSGASTFHAHAKVLRGVIDVLGLRRFAFIGHDSGGSIARIAAAGDDRVAAIVLGNTEIPRHHPWQITLLKAISLLPGFAYFAMLGIGPLRRSTLGLGGAFADPRYADGEFERIFIAPLRDRSVAQGQMRLVHDFTHSEVDTLEAAHARIKAPVLCVWGEDDPLFPVPKVERMLSQFPGGGSLALIPRAKLLPHEDHPEAFARHARTLLEPALLRA